MNIGFRLAKAATLFGLILTSQAMAQSSGTVALTCPSKINLAYADVTLLLEDGTPLGAPVRFTCGSLSDKGRSDKHDASSTTMAITQVIADFVIVSPNPGPCLGKQAPVNETLTCKGAFEGGDSRFVRNAPEVKLTTRIR